MSEEAAAATGLSRRDLVHFLARRLHSLSGVLPLGIFLVNHLYENYQAVGPGGAARFDGIVKDLQANPVIIWVEIFGIGLPLLYHAFYGLFIAGEARYNTRRYRWNANWRFLFQRVSGVILIAYLAYHIWMTRLQPASHSSLELLPTHHIATLLGWLVMQQTFQAINSPPQYQRKGISICSRT